MSYERNWRILLIGGSTGTGKTSLAKRLSARLGIGHLLVDDIRLAIQGITTSDQIPALHFFLAHDDIWNQPVEDWQKGWISVGEVVSRALEPVIAHHVVVKDTGALIIEGDGILPHCVPRIWASLRDPAPADRVRALFLYEPDQTMLMGNLRQKTDRGFPTLPLEQQRTIVHAAWTFGMWLKSESEHTGFPVVTPHPWETLDERVLQVLGQ